MYYIYNKLFWCKRKKTNFGKTKKKLEYTDYESSCRQELKETLADSADREVACCTSWGHEELDATWQLDNNNNGNYIRLIWLYNLNS